jgi:hypothetical protein
MSDYAGKSKQSNSRPVADGVLQQREENISFGIVDNRAETSAQRKLQKDINYGSYVKQMKSLQHMASNSLQIKQAKTYQKIADRYTSVAQ